MPAYDFTEKELHNPNALVMTGDIFFSNRQIATWFSYKKYYAMWHNCINNEWQETQ